MLSICSGFLFGPWRITTAYSCAPSDEVASLKHYTRCLTEEEIDRVCAASPLPRDYGAYYGTF
jgi:hypothetical protein